MTRVLVTGGAGFIGSHLVRELVSRNYQVRVLDDLSSGYLKNLPKNSSVEFIRGSVNDESAVLNACREVDGVVHLAAMVSVPASVAQPQQSTQINLSGFIAILNRLRENDFSGKFVYASSSAVYGSDSGETALKEAVAPGHLLSPYAVDKYANELYANLYSELYGLRTLGLRFFNVYGPRQDPRSPYSGVISIFMDRASKNQGVTIYGDGEQTRDFIYAGDVAKAIAAGLNNDISGAVNVGTGKSVTVNELAAKISETFGVDMPVGFEPARSGDIKHSLADIQRLSESLGYRAEVDLVSGLRELKEWLALEQ